MIKVLLADDHDLVRTGIRRLLEDQPGISISGEAASGEEAIQLARDVLPDVILMDISMPGMGGMEATRKLVHSYPELKIIVVSMHNDEVYPQRLLKVGAKGYLTKGASVKEILHAIHEVMANRRYLSPDIAQQIALATTKEGKQSPFSMLSERELQVVLMLMDGCKVTDISRSLCLSPKTVSTYRHRVYEKLGVTNDMELVRLALRHGIIDEGAGR